MVDAAPPRAFRAALEAHGFTPSGLSSLRVASDARGGAVIATSTGNPSTDVLVEVFALGRDVDVGALAVALTPVPLSDWQAAGLLDIDGDVAYAPLRVTPHDVGPIVSDHRFGARARAAVDIVPGPGIATDRVLDALPRGEPGRALDLGTGSGYVALHLADRGHAVVATDLSQHALDVAAATFALNGVTGIDLRPGDRFAPVAGERFDLITCNPPFVIAPGEGLVYRDAPVRGDDFCRDLLRALPSHLGPGGVGVIAASWPEGDEVTTWWADLDLEGEVVRDEVFDPTTYARMFVHDPDSPDGAATVRTWLDWYAERGLGALHVGVLRLSRGTT